MASVSTDSAGKRRILFMAPDGERKQIRLGKIGKHDADRIKSKLEALVAAKVAGTSFDRETAQWLADIGEKLHRKLMAKGLVGPRKSAEAPKLTKLGAWLDSYLAGRPDVKPNTRRNLIYAK